MTVIDPLLEPRRARIIVLRSLLNYVLPLIALPLILLLPLPASGTVPLILSFALYRRRRPVEVWGALERPEKREWRRGTASAAFLRFWAERAGWPVERTLSIRRLLRVTSVVAYVIIGAWLIHSMITTGQ